MEDVVRMQIDRLTYPNQANPALRHIDLTVRQGDFLVITGGAASGKSTLLHAITGAASRFFDAELSGQVTVLGRDIADVPLNRMSDYVAYMMQEPQNQLISPEVYQDVAFGLCNQGKPLEEIDRTVREMLDFVGLKGYERRKTDALSGGEAQRVVLAGVMALGAPILLLDQPTAELDPKGRADLYQRLGQLNRQEGKTVVLVMDRLAEVRHLANRVVCLRDGEIVRECTPDEYSRMQPPHPLVRLTQGPGKDGPGRIVAQVSRAAFCYRDQRIGCQDVSLTVRQGDFLAVAGLNGSGKSTLAKLLIGLLKPDSGRVSLFGQELNRKNLSRIRARTGFLFQNPDNQIFAGTLAEEVGFCLRLRGEEPETIGRKVDDSLDFAGLREFREAHPQRLSRGQRQLLALASILVGDPEFVIADEPTAGLEESQGILIMDKLAELADSGKTVLVITHDLALAAAYANRLAVMHDHRMTLDIAAADLGSHLDEIKRFGLDFTRIIDREEE